MCLTGILFVLKTGIPWEDFPQEMGCCGMTLWNRLELGDQGIEPVIAERNTEHGSGLRGSAGWSSNRWRCCISFAD